MKDSQYLLPKMSSDDWSLEKKWDLSPTTHYYSFSNSGFKIHLAPVGVDWIGKHYLLTNQKKSRVYTNCTMLDPSVVAYRDNMIKKYENSMEQKSNQVEQMSHPQNTDNLVLVIKTYNFNGALTKDLSLSNIGTKYKIEGPMVSL